MKLVSLSVVLYSVFVVAACAKKAATSSGSEHHADAAVTADDPACEAMSQAISLHGNLEGYTASAAKKFHVKVDWSSPLVAGELSNSATLGFVDSHAEPLALKISSFRLFMPGMGHGSGKIDQMVVKQNAADPSVWSVEKIYFSMGGPAGSWVVDIEAAACGVSDKARVEIPVEVQ